MTGLERGLPELDELLGRFRRLRAAVVSDALDALGLRNRTMRPGISALTDVDRLVGRALTLKVVAVDSVPEVPYVTQFEAVELVGPGNVMVVATPSVGAAFWGELLTTRVMVRGCVGAVIDGYTRDLAQISDYSFPLWARGTHPADSAGRLDATEIGAPVVCGGVEVDNGDILLADGDGVVVVPAHLGEEVAARAETKAAREDEVRAALLGGERVQDVYERLGVM